MGNLLGRNRTKVMKITGESFEIKTPAVAAEALKGHPDHVLLNADAVRHFGVKAKPLDPGQLLRPKKLYFLLHLPNNFPDKSEAAPRPPRGPRPEFARRGAVVFRRPEEAESSGGGGGRVRVKVRMPRAQVEKFMEESRDDVEVAEKIIDLYLGGAAANQPPNRKSVRRPESQWKPALGSITEGFSAYRQKKQISFG